MGRQEYLSELLARLDVTVPPAAFPRLLWFLDELLHWNHRLNLTAITEPREAMEKHLVDSLTLVPLLEGRERVLDIGSGGGFPGIPLKLVFPELEVVSVDGSGKKIAFQRHVKRQLQLQGFTPLAERIENLAGAAAMADGFSLVVARAFASLADLVRIAVPFLRPDGVLLAMKGGEGERELQGALPVLRENRLACADIRHLKLPQSGAERTLLLIQKICPTPPEGGG